MAEAKSNTYAVIQVLEKLAEAEDIEETLKIVLAIIRESFDWAYGSFWALTAEFHKVTQEARFEKGVGLSGRTWKARELN